MRLFTRIVDFGIFTAAAEEPGTSRATVTYAMQSLERRLGASMLRDPFKAYPPRPRSRLTKIAACVCLPRLNLLGAASAVPQVRLRIDLQPAWQPCSFSQGFGNSARTVLA